MEVGVIFIHSTRKEPYAEQVALGLKPVETRTKDMLGRFVGQSILIGRTRDGHRAEVIGSGVITSKKFCTKAELDRMRDKTRIPKGSKYDCQGDGKWCYTIRYAKRTKPVPLTDYNVVSRTRSYAIVEI